MKHMCCETFKRFCHMWLCQVDRVDTWGWCPNIMIPVSHWTVPGMWIMNGIDAGLFKCSGLQSLEWQYKKRLRSPLSSTTPVCLLSVYLTYPCMTKSPRPSPHQVLHTASDENTFLGHHVDWSRLASFPGLPTSSIFKCHMVLVKQSKDINVISGYDEDYGTDLEWPLCN